MKLENREDYKVQEENINLLELINKDKTNIGGLKFLTHYELGKKIENPLVHLSADIQKFMLQLRAENPLIETTIDEDGGFSNFLFRLKNSKILNSVNILKYITSDIPHELKSVTDGNKIYIIRFYAALKNEVSEEEVEALSDNNELVIMEDNKYYHIDYDDKDSIEKYWSEDVYKAIFAVKKKGFYAGFNDPDKKANMEYLKEYAQEDTMYLFAKNPVTVDNLKNVTLAQIKVRTIPVNLKHLLRKKFKKFQNRVKRVESIMSKFGVKDDVVHDLQPDIIDPNCGAKNKRW